MRLSNIGEEGGGKANKKNADGGPDYGVEEDDGYDDCEVGEGDFAEVGDTAVEVFGLFAGFQKRGAGIHCG